MNIKGRSGSTRTKPERQYESGRCGRRDQFADHFTPMESGDQTERGVRYFSAKRNVFLNHHSSSMVHGRFFIHLGSSEKKKRLLDAGNGMERSGWRSVLTF